MFVSYETSKWELEIWAAAEVFHVGPVDGALYQGMTLMECGSERRISMCECVWEWKGEIEK